MKGLSNEKLALKVSYVTIAGNVVLSLFKFLAGILAGSGAMLSDAVHSASDVLSTIVVIIGVKIASKEADQKHPYGHERFECVAAIILAAVLVITGLGIGYSGMTKIINYQSVELAVPGALALVAAVVSILAKEAMYWYTRAAAKKTASGALMADAWHHRSDALSSIGSFAGILGARLGVPVLDPLASVLICVFIIKVSFDIFADSVNKMTDTACNDDNLCKIRKIIEEQTEIQGIDDIKTRMFGNRIYVDIEIRADREMSLNDSHKIAEKIHDEVETRLPLVKHCMVHVNPADTGTEAGLETDEIR